MATYISQTVLNQQGGVLLPGQVLDTSIVNTTYTQPQQQVQTPQSNPIVAAAQPQQQYQQPVAPDVLAQQLSVSAQTTLPLATVQANWNTGENFAQKYAQAAFAVQNQLPLATVQANWTPSPTQTATQPSQEYLLTVGSPVYTPSPLAPKQEVITIQTPISPFGNFFIPTVGATGVGVSATQSQTAIVLDTNTSKPFGIPQLDTATMSAKPEMITKEIVTGGLLTNQYTMTAPKSYFEPPTQQSFSKTSEPQSPTQREAINMAAAFEEMFPISFLKQSAEGIQYQNRQGDWFGNYSRDFVAGLIRTPEMLGKTGIATAGVLKAEWIGDTAAFSIGVPATREAVFKSVSDPGFYASAILTTGMIGAAYGGKGGYSANLFEKTKFDLNSDVSYSGISSVGKPLVGIKTIAGEKSVVIGTPKFAGERPGIIAASENRADVGTLAEFSIKQSAYMDYAKVSGKPAIGERFALVKEGASSTYFTDIPFTKTIDTMMEAPALKGLSTQTKSELVGYFKANKGQIDQIYGSYASDVRGASARGFNDIDLHIKNVKFSEDVAGIIKKGGSEVELTSEGMLTVNNVKAFDFKLNTKDVGATTTEGSGSGIGFGFTPKRAVMSPEKFKFMATGEQTVRVGSSMQFLREGTTGEYLGGAANKAQRMADLISLVEKSSEVSGNKKFANFGEKIKPYLNPDELVYMKENPMVAGKLKLYESPSVKGYPSFSLGTTSLSAVSFKSIGSVPASRSASSSSISGMASLSSSSVSQSLSVSSSISQNSPSQSFKISPSSSSSKSPSITSLSPSLSVSPRGSSSISISGMNGFSPSPSPSWKPSQSFNPSPPVSLSPSLTDYPSPIPSLTPSPSPSPSPSFSFLPPSPPSKPPGGGLGGLFPSDSGSDLFGKPGKRLKGKYQPSFIALTLGLKTTKAQGLKAEKTGFDIRGLIGSSRKRK